MSNWQQKLCRQLGQWSGARLSEAAYGKAGLERHFPHPGLGLV